jgi:hypothetical protein
MIGPQLRSMSLNIVQVCKCVIMFYYRVLSTVFMISSKEYS